MGTTTTGNSPGGALEFYFDGGVPHESLKWGSKELTTRVKYGVLGTETIPGSVETRVYGTAQLPRVRRLYIPRLRLRSLYRTLALALLY